MTTSSGEMIGSAILRVFEPGSPHARGMFDLGVEVSVILTAIFALVAGMIVFALMRFRGHEGEADPVQFAGSRTVEIIWTGIPCVIVIVLFFMTTRTMGRSDPPPAPKPDMIVIGHQWWWEARYAKSGAVAANEIHIPVGRAFSIQLDSMDVLHEFWVPELARKITAVPGHPNHLWIEADKPGIYLGVCSEFCGTQHAWMRFLIIAETPAKFNAWEKAQLEPALPPVGDDAAEGRALFRRKSCVNCHAINGEKGEARVGPDLTHFASRTQFGSGIVTNTPESLRRWLKDPQQVKPGAKMPDFKLSDEQLTQLVSYIETLK